MKTKLREVHGSLDSFEEKTKGEVIHRKSKHLTDTIGKAQITLIEFTNSKEADQSLNDLLPPKEVLMNTNILMQESTNVFELAPAERVQVFKHLFGLLGIDEAKETINENRKELQTMIKVKSDTQHQSQKLHTTIQQI